ncbi:MAG TPA: hypothetical protein VFI43_00060 [Nitrosospira sp.]|nr:hypothetical protein [Nitrosospira sp.]
MLNVGAFAGGLAQGIRSGQEMQVKAQTADRLARTGDQETEMHQFRMDKAAFEKDKRNRLKAANEEIAAGWEEVGQGSADESPASVTPGLKDLASPEGRRGETVPAGLASESPAAGLSQLGKLPAPRAQAMQRPDPAEAIGRRMLVGDLLENKDELTRMANIYKKHGLLADMLPWMNSAYSAKKKRIPDALHLLLAVDAKGAREALRQGGINLTDDPVQVNPGNGRAGMWKFRFEGNSEKEIGLRELARKFIPYIRNL